MISNLRSPLALAVTLLFGISLLPAQTARPGAPYAAWSFDAKDKEAFVGTGSAPRHQLTGSVTGEIARVAGVQGQALHFTQDEIGHLSIPIDLGLISKGPFSVEVWLRPGLPTKDYETIVDSGGHRGFTIRLGSGRRISASVDQKWNLINASERVVEGVWIHVVATFDGSVFRLYTNGKEVGNHTIESPLRLGSALQIGRVSERIRLPDGSQDDALVKPLDGDLDELKIHTRVLSPAEIATAARAAR